MSRGANFGWNLPPGVRECDIPGNRPKDAEVELYVVLTQGEVDDLRDNGDWDEEEIKNQLLDQKPRPTHRELKKRISERIKKIEEDSRFQDESALVEVNAPLALIQVHLKSEHQALKWVLENL